MYSRQGCLLLVSAIISALVLSGCASGRKQKLEQREKLAASSGLYCDFVNGDKNKEVEVELNVLMAKKCDADRPFTITNYKSPAEVTGVLYCCAIKKETHSNDFRSEMSKPEVSKPEAVKAEPKAETKPVVSKPAATTPAAVVPPKGQAPVDKKATQPQDKKSNKTDLEEEIVPL
jgi:hypothetical protein